MRSAMTKHLGALLGSVVLLAGCGGGGGGGGNDSPDVTPAQFVFTDQGNVAVGTVRTSAPVMITGIDAPAAVTVAGGTYSVGCTATYVGTAGTISDNQTVCVRHTAAAAAGTATNTTLTIGGMSDVFTSTTAGGAGPDTTPAPFSFTDQTGVAASTVITSAPVTITAIDAPAAVTVSGGTYSVGCTASYVGTAGTISNNQTVCVRHTSAAADGTVTSTTLTVGGVSDVFTSTTAGGAPPVVGLLPFVTGAGALRLLDPTVATGAGNPVTVDTGLAPPPAGAVCIDCFGNVEAFFTASVSASAVSNLHASRLAYAKRASGNDSGGTVYRVSLAKGASNAPVQISSRTDACRIVRSETTDYANIDNTAVVIERAGADLSCSAVADNVATVIRLSSAATDDGVALPLALDTGNPLHARTSATGTVTGYVSFEVAGPDAYLLVRRDVNLANPVTLLTLGQATGANLARADLTHLFVTATPVEQGLQLFRVEGNGSLSPMLHAFAGFNAGNPIEGGLRDAANLYFTDENQLLRIPVDSTTPNAAVITTLDCTTSETCLRIEHRALDGAGRVVFEAQDSSITVAGGVFSAATTAADAPATVLAHNGDSLGGFAVLEVATGGRAYINVAHHGGDPTHADALKVNADATEPVTTASAYWAGSTRATEFDPATTYAAPTATVFLATHAVTDGIGTDTLRAVNPADGVAGAVLGSVDNASVFLSINVNGLGRYTLARVERDRSGNLDYDVFAVDAAAAGSLAALATTDGATDLPLDSLQRLTGNLCLLCL